jgi:S-methylmethionine-dependent homocysteine/selenocysteine methylase
MEASTPMESLDWRERLHSGPSLLLDGATGTELEARGVRCELPLWSAHALIEAPDIVRSVHAAYVAAGAELVTANTFRTQRRTLARGGCGERAAELTQLAVRLAREGAAGADHPVAVLGSTPPLEDCFAPELVPSPAELDVEHAEHAHHLALAGVDGILIETMNTLREAKAALRAARAVKLPALVSFVCWRDATLLSGETLAEAIHGLRDLAPDAVLVNCLPISNVDACIAPLAACGLPFGVYANLGGPHEAPSDDAVVRHREDVAPDVYAAHAREWLAAGASIIGSCCGTSPAYTATLAQSLRN